MQSTRRRKLLVGGFVSLSLVAAACGSSGGHTSSPTTGSSSSTTGGSSSPTTGSAGTTLPNQIYAENNTGTPKSGGTLTMLGTGDVDYMDPNISYYSIGYLGLRLWARSLYTYPAIQGQTTTLVPDLATAMPVISDGGLKYAITIRTGAKWNTTPARQVTAADEVLGVKRTCNPVQPFGGSPDFSALIVGYASFCAGFAKVAGTVRRHQGLHRRQPDLRCLGRSRPTRRRSTSR